MKRFTETQKWDDPWFRRLSPELKHLWQWLLDHCDNAGVIEPDIELASFQIGYQYPMDTLSKFGDRVVKIDGAKYFIPKFIGFQYGILSTDCKAHNPVFQSLNKHFPKGYPKGIHTLQEKEREKDSPQEGSQEGRKTNGFKAPTIDQAISAGNGFGVSEPACREWWQSRESTGWVIASGGTTRPITNWQTDLSRSKGWAEEQAAKNGGKAGRGFSSKDVRPL
jgi:hypothetical protein